MSETDEKLVKQDAERVRKMAREITAELGNVMDVAGLKTTPAITATASAS
jgi:hypothetical protein